jgi:hypothetical protein
MKAPAFARTIGVSETTFRNYIDRDSKPSSDVLEKISNSFEKVNITWLVTGNGEPFILPANENNQTTAHAEKFFRSPVVGTNHGTAYQENNATPAAADVEALKTKLALAEKEVEHLKVQLAMKDALLNSKEETLALLRISFNRPN